MKLNHSIYPDGLKPGDFIQTTSHFGDVYFEVTRCMPPCADSNYWHINYVKYEKYGTRPIEQWVNSASNIRAVIQAEMAVPTMLKKRLRFHSVDGHFDPLYGYAPKGTPLRKKEEVACKQQPALSHQALDASENTTQTHSKRRPHP